MKFRAWKLKYGFLFLASFLKPLEFDEHNVATDCFIDSGPHTKTPTQDPLTSSENLEIISVDS